MASVSIDDLYMIIGSKEVLIFQQNKEIASLNVQLDERNKKLIEIATKRSRKKEQDGDRSAESPPSSV
jgi:hypothetical protein